MTAKIQQKSGICKNICALAVFTETFQAFPPLFGVARPEPIHLPLPVLYLNFQYSSKVYLRKNRNYFEVYLRKIVPRRINISTIFASCMWSTKVPHIEMKKIHIISSVALALFTAIPSGRAASICASALPAVPSGIPACMATGISAANCPLEASSPLFPLEVSMSHSADNEKESSISRAKLNSLVSICRTYKNVEIVKVGSVGMSLLKFAARISAEDEEDREALRAMNGIKSISVMDYSECRAGDMEAISARIDNLLAGKAPIMEVKDDGEAMFIYGVVSEDGGKIEDFVLYTPSDCALIVIFGSIDTAALMESAN